jgi:hypothetical protein
MKKLLFLAAVICACIGFTSCSSDKDDPITMSLANTSYTLPNEDGASITITVNASAPVPTAISVPFVVAGGTEGTDYTLSANAFTFKAGETSASVVMSRAGAAAQQNITLSLTATTGVQLGAVNYATITLVGSNIYTFSDSNDKLSLDKSYAIELETASGSSFSYTSEATLDVEVVADGTTAVEGTHYEFPNGKKATFAAGSSKGYVALRFLKLEDGKDKIVLKVADAAKLYPGNNPTLTIKIVGPTDFSGTWAFEKVTNASWLEDENYMGFPPISTIVDGTPENDQFTLTGDNGSYTFTPNFAGKLKNYFTAAGKAVADGTRTERYQEAGGWPVPTFELNLLKIDNINLSMDLTTKNYFGSYDVGVTLTRNDDGEERLWMTIFQYRPVENTVQGPWYMTFKEIVEDYMDYDSTDPTMSMATAPIRIYFTRVQN